MPPLLQTKVTQTFAPPPPPAPPPSNTSLVRPQREHRHEQGWRAHRRRWRRRRVSGSPWGPLWGWLRRSICRAHIALHVYTEVLGTGNKKSSSTEWNLQLSARAVLKSPPPFFSFTDSP